MKDCLVIAFYGSLLTRSKKVKPEDGGDSLTASLICPEQKEDVIKIQKAFLHAFNHSLYMIDPTRDLPDVEDGRVFTMDVWRGGDKFADSKVITTEDTLKIDGEEAIIVPYDNVLSCKIIYNLKKEEIPDTD